MEIAKIPANWTENPLPRQAEREDFKSSQFELCFEKLLECTEDSRKTEELRQTPSMAAKAFSELTEGYGLNPHGILRNARLPLTVPYEGVIEIQDIPFMSLCEHVFLPFYGKAQIRYQPGQYLAGAGAFESLIKAYAHRLQLQENLTAQVADTCFGILEPKWVQVQMEATHTCMKGQRLKTEVTRSLNNS